MLKFVNNDEKVFKDFREKTLDNRRVTKFKNNGLEQGSKSKIKSMI